MSEITVDNKSNDVAQTLPFHVVAVPQTNVSQLLNTAVNTLPTPVNIKIKVRNKKEMVQKLGLYVPKFSTIGPKQIRLVSSDQTIMSFDLFMGKENEKKVSKKHHYKFLNLFKPSGCFNNQNDDDINPYIPSSSTEEYKTKSVSDINDLKENKLLEEKFALKKNVSPINFTKKTPKFLGKCKPGGCLDPPFTEDKYIYKPKMFAIEEKNVERGCSNVTYLKKEANKDNTTEKSKMALQDLTSQSSLKNSYSHLLITYPPAITSSNCPITEAIIQNQASKFKTSLENKVISVNECTGTYFMPKKRNKENTIENTYEEINKEDMYILINQKKTMLSTNEGLKDKNVIELSSCSHTDVNSTNVNLIDETGEEKMNTVVHSFTTNTKTYAAIKSYNGERNTELNVCKIDLNRSSTTALINENTMNIEILPTISKDSRVTTIERFSKDTLDKSKLISNKSLNNISLISQEQGKLKSSRAYDTSENMKISQLEKKKESKENLPKLTYLQNTSTANDSITSLEQNKLNSPVASIISTSKSNSQESFSKLIKLMPNKLKKTLKSKDEIKQKSPVIPTISEDLQISTLESSSQESFHKLSLTRHKSQNEQLNASQEDIKLRQPIDNQSIKTNIFDTDEPNKNFKHKRLSNNIISQSSPNIISEHLLQIDNQVHTMESLKLHDGSLNNFKQIQDIKEITDILQQEVEQNKFTDEDVSKNGKNFVERDVDKMIYRNNNQEFPTSMQSEAEGNKQSTSISQIFTRHSVSELKRDTLPLEEESGKTYITVAIDLKPDDDNYTSNNIPLKSEFLTKPEMKETISSSLQEQENDKNEDTYYDNDFTLAASKIENVTFPPSNVHVALSDITSISQISKGKAMDNDVFNYENKNSISTSQTVTLTSSQPVNLTSSFNLQSQLEKNTSTLHTAETKVNKIDFAASQSNILVSHDALYNSQVHDPDDAILSDVQSTDTTKIQNSNKIVSVIQSLISIDPTEIKHLEIENDHILSNLYTRQLAEYQESSNNDYPDIKTQTKINNSEVAAILSDNDKARYNYSGTYLLNDKKAVHSDNISKNFHNIYTKPLNTMTPEANETTSKEDDNIMYVTESEEKNDLQGSSSFIKINFGFYTYLNDKNEILIKSFDTSEHLKKNLHDKQTTIIKSIIRKNGNEITIPVNPEINLNMQIIKTLDDDITTRQHTVNTIKQSSHEESTKLVHKDIQLQQTLKTVYEYLIPVENIIRNLKQEADFLTEQQMLLREILNTMKKTSNNIIKKNHKCSCSKYL